MASGIGTVLFVKRGGHVTFYVHSCMNGFIWRKESRLRLGHCLRVFKQDLNGNSTFRAESHKDGIYLSALISWVFFNPLRVHYTLHHAIGGKRWRSFSMYQNKNKNNPPKTTNNTMPYHFPHSIDHSISRAYEKLQWLNYRLPNGCVWIGPGNQNRNPERAARRVGAFGS